MFKTGKGARLVPCHCITNNCSGDLISRSTKTRHEEADRREATRQARRQFENPTTPAISPSLSATGSSYRPQFQVLEDRSTSGSNAGILDPLSVGVFGQEVSPLPPGLYPPDVPASTPPSSPIILDMRPPTTSPFMSDLARGPISLSEIPGSTNLQPEVC